MPLEEVNALDVPGWTGVLRHEYRHIVQATTNPNMAEDFRDTNRQFTSYGALEETCAD